MKILLFLSLLLGATVHAQQYAIDRHRIAGGGGTSTGGVFAASGTIGQPEAGAALSGGNYSVTGGFWSLVSVVQTPDAPTLYLSRSGNNVTIFWRDMTGWSLQQNASLTTPADWSASGGIETTNGTNSVTIRAPTGNQFFRLMHP